MAATRSFITRLLICIALLTAVLALMGCPETRDQESTGPETVYDPTHPANNGDVHGIVYVDGAPQAYGIVKIYDADDNYLKECRCTQTGEYDLDDFVPGKYVLKYINAVGNSIGDDVEVEIRPGRDIEVNLRFTH